MKIRRWLRNWLNQDIDFNFITEKDHGYSSGLTTKSMIPGQRIDNQDRVIRLSIYNAAGGRIVETNKYDSTKDRCYANLYIITSEQDFGRELDKILTLESLRG